MALRSTARPFGKLLRDTAGNTLAIMAASLFPLVGMVGGAVDMSRLYLVKTRLQQACDAGALAGRRVMVGRSVEADSNAMLQAQNFFKINLREGDYGSDNVQFVVNDVREGGVPAGNLTGRVAGTATADVPMTLMRIFGSDTKAMTATCEANLNIANNDIMFVLDLTGSMGCRPDNTGPCYPPAPPTGPGVPQVAGVWRVPEAADSRIVALRAAVSQFFTTLNGATPDSARLRIAFMPYSSSANVAGILPAGSLAQTHVYRSRAANMSTKEWGPTTVYGTWGNQQTYSGINNANCTKYGNNESFTQGSMSFTGGPNTPPSAKPVQTNQPSNTSATYYRRKSWSGTGTSNGTCTRESATGTTSYAHTGWWGFTNFVYGLEEYNVSNATLQLADMTSAPLRALVRTNASGTYNDQKLAQRQAAGTATGVTTVSRTWDMDCVEERQENANIDLLATSEPTRWKPARRDLVYYPSTNVEDDLQPLQSKNEYTCTMPAQRLQVMTQAQVNAYVANPRFAPHGATYHDIGMIWGTRMMSLNGAFAADHSGGAPNGREVRRHIIFMTDGDMQPSTSAYSPYGVEYLDRRISTASAPTAASLKTLHNQRFAAACANAKGPQNISVWVVSFGQALTPQLIDCANNGQARQADNAAQLDTMLQEIAQKIAELRLSE